MFRWWRSERCAAPYFCSIPSIYSPTHLLNSSLLFTSTRPTDHPSIHLFRASLSPRNYTRISLFRFHFHNISPLLQLTSSSPASSCLLSSSSSSSMSKHKSFPLDPIIMPSLASTLRRRSTNKEDVDGSRGSFFALSFLLLQLQLNKMTLYSTRHCVCQEKRT